MQKVAGYVMFSPALNAVEVAHRFDEVQKLVVEWLAAKGERRQDNGETKLTLSDGRIARYQCNAWKSDSGQVIDHILVEPTGNATLKTQVSVAQSGSRVIAFVELQAGSGAYQVGPMHIDIRTPLIVRRMVSAFNDWQVGETPLAMGPYHFEGKEGGRQLEEVIWHPRRNLPVVAISSHEGMFLTD